MTRMMAAVRGIPYPAAATHDKANLSGVRHTRCHPLARPDFETVHSRSRDGTTSVSLYRTVFDGGFASPITEE